MGRKQRPPSERQLASRFARGVGIDIGASHLPFPVDPDVAEVRYVDRWTREQMLELFPELKDAPDVVRTDVVCDLALEGLGPIEDESLDFVIASHVLEHLPNPLGTFRECHRVLRDGGVFVLVLPDKRFTFDHPRAVTPLSHLIEDLEQGTTSVDDAHMEDFVVHVVTEKLPEDPSERRRRIEQFRDRSIHVHVWDTDAMLEFTRYMVGDGEAPFDLIELFLARRTHGETVFVLGKRELAPDEAAKRFDAAVAILRKREEWRERDQRALRNRPTARARSTVKWIGQPMAKLRRRLRARRRRSGAEA